MLETSPEEIREAVDSLGDGHHQMKDIENEIVRLRHLKVTLKKKRKKNK
jgi:hypothetical protein